MSNRLKMANIHAIIGLFEQDCISIIRETLRYYKPVESATIENRVRVQSRCLKLFLKTIKVSQLGGLEHLLDGTGCYCIFQSDPFLMISARRAEKASEALRPELLDLQNEVRYIERNQ